VVGDGGEGGDLLARSIRERRDAEGVAFGAAEEIGEAETGDGRVEGEARVVGRLRSGVDSRANWGTPGTRFELATRRSGLLPVRLVRHTDTVRPYSG
jgi:hypothetical protein